VGITVGSGLSVGRTVGRILGGGVGAGRAVARGFGLAEAVGAGVTIAGPAAAAADGGVGLGEGVTLAVGCGLASVAMGVRRELHCSATTANTATMTRSARVDAPSADPNDVPSESHRGFLCMASVPPCEPSPAGGIVSACRQKKRVSGTVSAQNWTEREISERLPSPFPSPACGGRVGVGAISSPCWRIRSCRSRSGSRSCP
jgi:hypothetical protein